MCHLKQEGRECQYHSSKNTKPCCNPCTCCNITLPIAPECGSVALLLVAPGPIYYLSLTASSPPGNICQLSHQEFVQFVPQLRIYSTVFLKSISQTYFSTVFHKLNFSDVFFYCIYFSTAFLNCILSIFPPRICPICPRAQNPFKLIAIQHGAFF